MRQTRNRRCIGTDYERAAGVYLEEKGLKVLIYNYRCRLGEIDLIARDGDTLVFCEVKYRSGRKSGSPLEAVGVEKQNRIFRSAMCYLTENGITDLPCRFDVIGIEGTVITHIENAFTG